MLASIFRSMYHKQNVNTHTLHNRRKISYNLITSNNFVVVVVVVVVVGVYLSSLFRF